MEEIPRFYNYSYKMQEEPEKMLIELVRMAEKEYL